MTKGKQLSGINRAAFRSSILFMLLLITHSMSAQSLPDTVTTGKQPRTQLLQNKVDSLTGKLDSLATLPTKHLEKLQSKADSLPHLLRPARLFHSRPYWHGRTGGHPLDKITNKADSLQNRLLSKGNNLSSKVEEKINSLNKTEQLQKSVGEKLSNAHGKTKLPVDIGNPEKLNEITQNAKSITDGLPDTGFFKEKLPVDINGKLPTIDVQGKLKELTGNTSELDKVKGRSSKATELSTMSKTQADKLKGLTSEKDALSEKLNISEIKNVTDKTADLKGISDEAVKYKEDISALSKGNIEEVKQAPAYLENRLKNIEGVSTVENHQAAMDAKVADFTQPSKGLKPLEGSDLNKLGDKEYLKEQAMPIGRQALQQLKKNVDHFAKHADKIKAAQGKLAKLKRKYSSLESMKNPPTRPNRFGQGKRNSLKGKTLGERLTIGGNFQLYKTAPFGVDISPQLAYQLTKKLAIGIGGTYRTGINKEKDFLFTKEKEAYGFRAYSEHEVYKSFYAHGEFERLHAQENKALTTDIPSTQWNSNALIGIGKTYNFTKGIKGNVMVLYNFLNDKTDPYRRPWNIRFGFELKGSKKDKSKRTEVKSSVGDK